jgi:MFS family permease
VPAPLHRTVKALGAVSLLTDVSSEMIYPLLPAFLTGPLRAGPALLGAIEGLAESVASLVKIGSGYLSDRLGKRKLLVVLGYGLSSMVRPLVALATAATHVLAIRVLDRLGKGVRGAPRDALVAEVTPENDRGRAFGFQRAMDHTGALLGPLLAAAILSVRDDLRLVFAVAAVPAIAAMLVVVFGVAEDAPKRKPAEGSTLRLARSPITRGDRAPLPGPLQRYLLVLAVFTLGNSSDAFLLLRAQEAGIGLAALPLLWSLNHLVKSAASTWGGALSDRIGRRATILAGWGVYALAYAGFAWAEAPVHIWGLFAFYGLFHALTEGPERALVADLASGEAHGRAFGYFHAVTGVMLLPASLLTGLLWQQLGAGIALYAGAGLAGLAALLLLLLVPEPTTKHS